MCPGRTPRRSLQLTLLLLCLPHYPQLLSSILLFYLFTFFTYESVLLPTFMYVSLILEMKIKTHNSFVCQASTIYFHMLRRYPFFLLFSLASAPSILVI